MDEKDIRTLHILESVEREKQPSQRDLARELNVSLGLVNAFIKRLAKKGYFKITHIPRNRMRYILTPEGAAEKTRLTYAYILHSYRLYKNAHQKIQDLVQEMEGNGVRRLVLYGGGDLAEVALLLLADSRIRVAGVVDGRLAGTRVAGRTVEPETALKTLRYDKVLITSAEPRPRVVQRLERAGVPAHIIATL